jgi:subfamily B ATP-binding cassette protein MsbA
LKTWLHQLAELANILRYLRPYVAERPWLFVAVLGSSLSVMCFEGIGVGLLVPLLNLLLGGENASTMHPVEWLQRGFPGRSAAFYVSTVCTGILVAIAAKNAAFYTSQILAARLKRQVSVSLRNTLFARLQRADLDVFDRTPAGELSNVFLLETYRATTAIDVLLGMLQRTSIALFYLAALLYLSWPLTILVLALSAGLGATLSFVYRRLTRAGEDVTDTNNQLASALAQSFAGIRTQRVTNSQRRERDRFHTLNVAQAEAEQRSSHATSLLFPLTETLAVAGGMLIVASAYILLVRPGIMLNSFLLAFGFVLLRLLPLLNQLWGLQGHLFYLAGGVREVQTWLQTPEYPNRPFGTDRFTALRRELRCEGISYRYPNGTLALDDVSFSVGVGETVAIVGPSGSGKSTLAAIVLRLRTPSAGSVTADGRDTWSFSPENWHRATAFVEQDAFLFNGTVRDNILYGCDDLSADASAKAGPDVAALHRAVQIANLEEFVASLPAGLDTLVGERGVMVSGGQRQRIAIARAVIRNPQILVLDEATSHLDNVSEQLVQQALQNAARGRTTIVIAHRLSTIRDADKLVVLDRGRIVEQGTWESLAAAGGTFQRLVAVDVRD